MLNIGDTMVVVVTVCQSAKIRLHSFPTRRCCKQHKATHSRIPHLLNEQHAAGHLFNHVLEDVTTQSGERKSRALPAEQTMIYPARIG